MSATELLARLDGLGIVLVAEADKLKVSAERGRLDEGLRQAIGAHKAELLQLLTARATASGAMPSQPIARIARDAPLALSYFQERLWFLQQLEPGSTAFNVVALVAVPEGIGAALVVAALAALFARHEILRTTFAEEGGEPCAHVLDAAPDPFEVIDLGHLPAAEQLARVRADAEAAARVPFDLAREAPARATVYRMREDLCGVLLSAHHIAVDAWSIGVLARELAELCASGGAAPPRNDLQYADFAAWQRRTQDLPAISAELDWWAGTLAGAPELSTFPADPPTVPRAGGAAFSFTWDVQLAAGLHALVREEGATLYMALVAACAAVLRAHTGIGDVVLGSPMGVRERPELETMVGPFVNVQVLRLDLSDDPSFAQLLRRSRDAFLDAHAHRQVPFERLVERVKPARSFNHSPVFQVAVVQHNAGSQAGIEIFGGGALHELTWFVRESDGALTCSLEYRSDLYTVQAIERIAAQLQALLRAAVADRHLPLSQASLLAPGERERLLVDFNATATPLEAARFPLQFERQAAAAPDRIAVTCAGQSLAYGDLNRRANQLAHHLRSLGIGPGKLVALLMERSLSMLVALLAIQKSGGAYVPLDPGFPAERVAFMLEDSGAGVLVATGAALASIEPPARVTVVDVEAQATALAALDDANLASEGVPDDLAYVIYTSGSTGKPKGVEISHRALANFLGSMAREPGLGADDVLAAVTTISFDIAGLELYLPLTVGARVELVSRETASDAAALSRTLAECGATVLQATPATWRMLVEAEWRPERALRAFCGGEALPRDLAQALLDRVSALWNLYGPTETTIWSTLSRVTDTSRPIPIGRPIANTQVYVLGPSGLLAPIGVGGELCIGGDGLARGYRNRDDLTAEKFVMVDLPDVGPTRVYRTGDVVRFLADGQIEFVGRRDHQLKVRGFRIELGEIETVLATNAGVKECVVHVREDTPGDQRLVGYVVAATGESFDADSARATLRTELPEYMVPHIFVMLEALPLTPNGKIDRKALPAPDAAGTVATDEHQEPVTETEKGVAQVFVEVLKIPAVGLRDNFFELGGHSLLATRALTRLRERFEIDVPLAAIFQAPTVEGLSRWIDAALEKQQSPAQLELAQVDHLPRWKCLVPVPSKSSRPPLFLITGYLDEDDTLRILSNLIPHLGPDRPLCGLRPRWLDGRSPQYSSVAEMSDEYLSELRTFQPQGPYYLLGDCVGGVVAVEMAQTLLEQGDEVALLVLLDTERPRFLSSVLNVVVRLQDRGHHVASVLRQILRPTEGTRTQAIIDVIRRKLRRAGLSKHPITAADYIYQHRTEYQRLLKKHRLKRYPGCIRLIVSEDVYQFVGLLGWNGFADGGVEIFRTPGNHQTFRTEYSREFGQQLRLCIDLARSEREKRVPEAADSARRDVGPEDKGGDVLAR